MSLQLANEAADMVSLQELCKLLSISMATGKNWVKLGKLQPTDFKEKTPYFAEKYVSEIQSSLKTETNVLLKSRRNKKYISGNNIYNSYVSELSQNITKVHEVLATITEGSIEITDEIILAVLAECSIHLMCNKLNYNMNKNGLLSEYLEGTLNLEEFAFLIEDLLRDVPSVRSIVQDYPKLFSLKYVYEPTEDILGLLYISLKHIGLRKATGSYYTPTRVVKKLVQRLFLDNVTDQKTFFDPCCGTGNFLLQLPSDISFANIYGNDMDSICVRLARINMALKYNVTDQSILYGHITEYDYLVHHWDQKFDFIIGNPPWGYDYTEDEKASLRKNYISAQGSSVESYDVFIEQALSDLASNGVLAFVLPEAILNVKTHMPIRRVLLQGNSFQYLEFLGNAFDKVQCPCIILSVIHNGFPFSSAGLVVNNGLNTFTIRSIRKVDAECLSFSMTDEEYNVLDKVVNMTNKTTLKGRAQFALGIVTGNNKAYITNQKTNENEMILKGADLYKFRYKDTDSYIVFNPESFQQVAPTECYRAHEKLLYRFICNQLVFAYDNRQTLSLNSCNLLIPEIEGIGIKYIMAVLNSRVAQFFFRKQFNSVKVLRSHIEQIPIPCVNDETQSRIVELVERILMCNEDVITDWYEKLDYEVMKLFGLNEQEYTIIKNAIDDENKFLV